MVEVQKFSSFEEMKLSELQDTVLQISEEKLKENLDKFIAISLLNPKNHKSNLDSICNER